MKNINRLIYRLANEAVTILFKKNSDYDYSNHMNEFEALIDGFMLNVDENEAIKVENTIDRYGLSIEALKYILSLDLNDRLDQVEYYESLQYKIIKG